MFAICTKKVKDSLEKRCQMMIRVLTSSIDNIVNIYQVYVILYWKGKCKIQIVGQIFIFTSVNKDITRHWSGLDLKIKSFPLEIFRQERMLRIFIFQILLNPISLLVTTINKCIGMPKNIYLIAQWKSAEATFATHQWDSERIRNDYVPIY